MSEFEVVLHSKNHVVNHVTPKKCPFVRFPCFFKTHGFDLEVLHCVTLGFRNTLKNQIFYSRFYNVSKIEMKLFQRFRIYNRILERGRNLNTKIASKITFRITLHHEKDIFCVFCASSKSRIIIQQIYDASNFEIHFYNVSVFEIIISHCLRLGVRKLTRIRFCA